MSDENFWAIIAETKSDNQDTQSRQLKTRLTQLSKNELIDFESTYRKKLRKAYTWDLWAGAYIINGGCSDDGFDYFRDWLISRGQKTYQSALKNPETLINEATPWDTEYEDFRYIMIEVMEEVHKTEFPMPTVSRSSEPAGTEWDEETVETKYPKLSEWINKSQNLEKPITQSNTNSKFSILRTSIIVGVIAGLISYGLMRWLS